MASPELEKHLPALITERFDWMEDMRRFLQAEAPPTRAKLSLDPMAYPRPDKQPGLYLKMDMQFNELRYFANALSSGVGSPTSIHDILEAKNLSDTATITVTKALLRFREKLFSIALGSYRYTAAYRDGYKALMLEAAEAMIGFTDLTHESHGELVANEYLGRTLTQRYGKKVENVLRRM